MLRTSLEIPMEKRRYERRWPIPASVRRYCVWSESPYDSVAVQFAKILAHIRPADSRIVLECSELYTPESEWLRALDRSIVEVSTSGGKENCMEGIQMNDEVVVKYSNYNYSFLCSSRDSLGRWLKLMKPREWYITYWSEGTPVPMLLEWACTTRRKRPEPYFIQNLGRYDPVVFLSYEHVHMEIMILSEALGKALAGLLLEIGGSAIE